MIEALVNGKTVLDYPCGRVGDIVLEMWSQVEQLLETGGS